MKYICSHCGYENNEGSKFCYKCGMPITFQENITSDPKINDNNKDPRVERSLNTNIEENNNNNLENLWKKEEIKEVTPKEERSRSFYSPINKPSNEVKKESSNLSYQEESSRSYYSTNNDFNSEVNEERFENNAQDSTENTSSSDTYNFLGLSAYDSSKKVEPKKEEIKKKEETPHDRDYQKYSEEDKKKQKRQFIINNIGAIKNHLIASLGIWFFALVTIILYYFVPVLSNETTIYGVVIYGEFSFLDSTKIFIEVIKYLVQANIDFDVLIKNFESLYGYMILMTVVIYLIVFAIISIVKIIKCIVNLSDVRSYGFDFYYKALRQGNELTVGIIIHVVLNILWIVALPYLSRIGQLSNIMLVNGYSRKIIYVAISLGIVAILCIFDVVTLNPLKRKIKDMERSLR